MIVYLIVWRTAPGWLPDKYHPCALDMIFRADPVDIGIDSISIAGIVGGLPDDTVVSGNRMPGRSMMTNSRDIARVTSVRSSSVTVVPQGSENVAVKKWARGFFRRAVLTRNHRVWALHVMLLA